MRRQATAEARKWRRLSLLLGVLAVAALAAALLCPLQRLRERLRPLPPVPERPLPPPEALADRLVPEPAELGDLRGWAQDAVEEALPALRRSCRAVAGLPPDRPMGQDAVAGTAGDWQRVCAAARDLPGEREAVRSFLESELRPVAVSNNGRRDGLFTGYYEPLVRGSRRRHGPYRVPLHARPPDLVSVDLGRFREDLAGRRIAGRLESGVLTPYPSRQQIASGALHGRGLELLWVDDPVDAFFLEIQGSGRVRLEDGDEVRVGYAAQNGHPYTAIGRELLARGELSREEVSMQSIRAWLETHPDEAAEVMAANASYVFFQELSGDGPVGAQGVVLAPGRSLAVDPLFLPLGGLLWLETTAPAPVEGVAARPLRRLMVAQDTGGAIRGPVRGDVFWGHGDEAAAIAGRMQSEGRLWLLVPR